MVNIFPLQSGDTGFVALGFKLGLITLVTGVVHVGLSYVFGLEEATPVIRKLRQFAGIALKPIRIDW